ncbi:MAG: hypothetical protein ACYC7L_08595 [Nitrospirota bacterium]
MHTDEFEISLGRELAVCEQYVRKYRKLIAGMEQRRGGPGAGDRAWMQARESLRSWSDTRDEYARLLAAMRQSAPS